MFGSQLQLSFAQKPEIPEELAPLLNRTDCALAISISGGKDSQAQLNWLCHLHKQHEWKAKIFCIHADLGRIEWAQTSSFVEKLASDVDLELVVVRREKGDLIDRWKQRFETLKQQGNTKPFWSSAAARYCTSEMKVAPIDKYLRRYPLSIVCLGLRASESTNRAKKAVISPRKTISSKRYEALDLERAIANYDGKSRLSINWLPVHDWSIHRVWEWCGTSTAEWERRRKLPDPLALDGWTAHPAYVLGKGNHRLSCSFCVLGDTNDLTNAIASKKVVRSILFNCGINKSRRIKSYSFKNLNVVFRNNSNFLNFF
jgi:3'-phosphoadenosine 5'-phosphosulfate sulfotransferase (PAPS reductase)/FAD synthetase